MDYMPELMFNIDNGYLEGLVRGFKSGILTRTDYLNLIQCETLEGSKSTILNYGNALLTLQCMNNRPFPFTRIRPLYWVKPLGTYTPDK